jgi:Skp family chaperone for outer membrane proteins
MEEKAMQKISSKDVQTILKQAGAAIRHLTGENKRLTEKLAADQKERRIVKLAQEMEQKGLNSALSFEEKVAELKGANLDVTEQAVKLAAPNMKLASVSDDATSGTGVTAFENFILTGEDASE